MRKLLLLFLSLFTTNFAFCQSVDFGDGNYRYDGIVYHVTSENTVEVRRNLWGNDYWIESAIIPATIPIDGKNYTVTAIAERAFSQSSITLAEIPETVTSIGDLAFYGSSKLTAINVAEGNPNYSSEDGVFFDKEKTILIQYPDAKADEEYTIPSTVKKLTDYSFLYTDNLHTLNIPASVIEITDKAIISKALASINVESDNEKYSSIDGVLFDKAQTLLIRYPASSSRTEYAMPNSVTKIGDNAFDAS